MAGGTKPPRYVPTGSPPSGLPHLQPTQLLYRYLPFLQALMAALEAITSGRKPPSSISYNECVACGGIWPFSHALMPRCR